MTVSSISPVNNYAGNGSSTIFDFDFLIEHPEELAVVHISASGIKNHLTLGVDYSINEIGNKNGSYIIFPLESSSYSILQSDEVLSLTLNLEIKQESEFENSSYLNLKVLEWTFDYIVRIIQMLSRKIDRSVKVDEGINVNPDKVIENLNEAQKKVEESAGKAEESAENAKKSADKAEELAEKTEKSENKTKEYLKQTEKCSDDTGEVYDNVKQIARNLEETFNNNHISNCVLRMPQRIKYEINEEIGTIRLKAGSEVFLPKSDGSIEKIILESDTPWNGDLWAFDVNFARIVLLFYCPELKCLKTCVSSEGIFHQETAPDKEKIPYYGLALWDNGNELKITYDSGTTWDIVTLPVLYGTPIWVDTDQNKNTLFKNNMAYSGWKKTVAEVFNGFGFFGRKIFSLPDVTMTVPDGLNDDGSYKNIIYTTDDVNIYDLNEEASRTGFFHIMKEKNKKFRGYGGLYCETDFIPEPNQINKSKDVKYYSAKSNLITEIAGINEENKIQKICYIGKIEKAAGSGNFIKYFKVDYAGKLYRKEFSDNDGGYYFPDYTKGVDMGIGGEFKSGEAKKFTAPASGWIYLSFGQSASNDHYTLFVLINEVRVAAKSRMVDTSYTGVSPETNFCFPVCKGDVLRLTNNVPSGVFGIIHICMFYKIKKNYEDFYSKYI